MMRFVLIIFTLLVLFAPAAQASEAAAAMTVTQAIEQSQSKIGAVTEATTKMLAEKIRDFTGGVKKAVLVSQAMKEEARRQVSPYMTWALTVARLNQDGQLLTDDLRKSLNDITLQTVLGYREVFSDTFGPNSTDEYNEGIYSKGALVAAARIYDTHVRMFCVPGTKNAPEGCGVARNAAGIRGGETFVDFMVGEKTWQGAYVLEVMKLARAYFGLVTDTTHLEDLRSNRDAFVRRQAELARNNMRLSIINYLAARRAPTSDAAATAQMMFMSNATDTTQLSDFNIDTLCARENDELSLFENMLCSYTSKPTTSGGERFISQAALDRILQFDIYLTPNFYKSIRDPQYAADGPIDQINVLLKAQQLAQDYQHLRMLQMKVASTAVATVSGGF